MATKKDMAMILGGELIPKPSNFTRIYEPNETDNVTLGGELYTDHINIRESWKATWKFMDADDYETLRALYFAQYTNEAYHYLQFDAYSIYAPAKLEIQNEQNIKYNGRFVENFSVIFKLQTAIS